MSRDNRCEALHEVIPTFRLRTVSLPACGTSPRPSRCLVSARTGSDREPSTRDTVVSSPMRPDLYPDDQGSQGVRAALATSLAADRRDGSI
jgi:hypothetical protein